MSLNLFDAMSLLFPFLPPSQSQIQLFFLSDFFELPEYFWHYLQDFGVLPVFVIVYVERFSPRVLARRQLWREIRMLRTKASEGTFLHQRARRIPMCFTTDGTYKPDPELQPITVEQDVNHVEKGPKS